MRLSNFTIVLTALAVGLAIGISGFTFVYAKGASYLTDDPRACANCHVMSEQYTGWLGSSHRAVAVCNDCHTPKGFIAKI
jgi:cytochrome c nitrite reductase small subunit